MPHTPSDFMTKPMLAITPSLVQWFEHAYRSAMQEEAKPLRDRDPRPAIRLYAQCEVFAPMLRATGVPGIADDEPGVILSALKDLLKDKPDPQRAAVHVTHCCSRHGCKYGEREYCPVASNLLAQKYPCEQCDEDAREAARAREDVHAARAGGAWTACGRRVADDDVQVAIQDYRVHVTCVDCRDEAGL